jgi:cytochrome b
VLLHTVLMTAARLLWILAVTVVVAVSVRNNWNALRALITGYKSGAQHVDIIACICRGD